MRQAHLKNPPQRLLVIAVLALFASTSQSAFGAGDKASREREALRRAQQMVSSLQQEKADLEQHNKETSDKLASTQAQLEAAKRELAASEKKLASIKQEATANEQASKALAEKLSEAKNTTASLDSNKQELEKRLQQREQEWANERLTLQTKLTEEQQNQKICIEKNQRLATVATEVLDRYEKKGFWDVFSKKEPFLGFKSVETENLLQDYRATVQDDRLEPRKN